MQSSVDVSVLVGVKVPDIYQETVFVFQYLGEIHTADTFIGHSLIVFYGGFYACPVVCCSLIHDPGTFMLLFHNCAPIEKREGLICIIASDVLMPHYQF